MTPRWQRLPLVQAIFNVDVGIGCVEKNASAPIGVKAFGFLTFGQRLTVLQVDKLTFSWTGIQLTWAADTTGRVFHHFFPLADPTNGSC